MVVVVVGTGLVVVGLEGLDGETLPPVPGRPPLDGLPPLGLCWFPLLAPVPGLPDDVDDPVCPDWLPFEPPDDDVPELEPD